MRSSPLSIGVLEAGRPWPLGATFDGGGVNFAVFSAHATQIQLCIFDESGEKELARLSLPEFTDQVWHGYLPGAQSGLVYGYRAFGPHAPERGHRFNSHKLLIDPYARQFTGSFRWSSAHFDLEANSGSINKQDNAQDTYKAVVIDDDFDWEDDHPPAIPLSDSILYETHVKGFTMRHPDVPGHLRGTYEGFSSRQAISHLRKLGVTAVSFLPVHQSIPEQSLVERGLTNYWGYNTIGFFAPDVRFCVADPVPEFKYMVKRLHSAGIEVILDVVYNHTAEGDHTGPTLSFRGLDNHSYYHLRPGDLRLYENFTGTGNSVNLHHPRALQLVMDSLRYWVTEMHVDGFRFDLAVTLARNAAGFDPHSSFFNCLRQDPVLARVKLIAEPWDIGLGGHQTGRFPLGWSEWNDRYRDTIRAFWVRETPHRGEVAARIAGSHDLFHQHGRKPQASINFITAHDGFTLHDLVSYNAKHNEANGENNQDGSTDNKSWNCGVEGPSTLLAINALRSRLKRALLATLFISQGMPMLLGGDELGRSQSGNNNAYCQDNDISWYEWQEGDESFVAFIAKMTALRRRYRQLRSTHWLHGATTSAGVKDITWLNREGTVMTPAQWEETGTHVLGILFGAEAVEDLTVLVLMNAESSDWAFPLPEGKWKVMLDTTHYPEKTTDPMEGWLAIKARSFVLLELV
ncbi:MAG: glycogen debranching protein GlgX [Pseudomonadota bacterium]